MQTSFFFKKKHKFEKNHTENIFLIKKLLVEVMNETI